MAFTVAMVTFEHGAGKEGNALCITGVAWPVSDGNRRACRHSMVSVWLPFVVTYQTANPWAALADANRRTIFRRLASGPMAVGELARELPISRPAVSQHLKVLKCAGLVQDRAEGTRRLYRADLEGIAALRAELDVFWDRALDAYRRIVEQEER